LTLNKGDNNIMERIDFSINENKDALRNSLNKKREVLVSNLEKIKTDALEQVPLNMRSQAREKINSDIKEAIVTIDFWLYILDKIA